MQSVCIVIITVILIRVYRACYNIIYVIGMTIDSRSNKGFENRTEIHDIMFISAIYEYIGIDGYSMSFLVGGLFLLPIVTAPSIFVFFLPDAHYSGGRE